MLPIMQVRARRRDFTAATGASHGGHGVASARAQAWRLLRVGQLRAQQQRQPYTQRRLSLQWYSYGFARPRQRLSSPGHLRGALIVEAPLGVPVTGCLCRRFFDCGVPLVVSNENHNTSACKS